MQKKLNMLNMISAVSFFLSSISLLFIPILKNGEKVSKQGCIVALFFWWGLLCGIALQICLALKCRKLKINHKTIKCRLPLFISAISFIVLMVFVVFKSNNNIIVVGTLFCTLLSLQICIIIRRKECLNEGN